MRLLLDAMLSWRIADQLQKKGHDVEALAFDHAQEDLSDDQVLDLATSQERAVVTCDIKDFFEVDRKWRERGREHYGVVLLPPSLPNSNFGEISTALDNLLKKNRDHRALVGQILWLEHA